MLNPDLPQFTGKAFIGRAVVYPIALLILPAGWWVFDDRVASRSRSRRHPARAAVPDRCRRNGLDLYDSVEWWDDANHLINWGLHTAGVGLLLRLGPWGSWTRAALAFGWASSTAVLWELAEYIAFVPNSPEAATAYQDTLGDLALGLIGGVVAAVLVSRLPGSPSRVPDSHTGSTSAGMPERRAWDWQPRFASRSDPADRIEGDTGQSPDSQRGRLTDPSPGNGSADSGPSVHREWNLSSSKRRMDGRGKGDPEGSGTLAAIGTWQVPQSGRRFGRSRNLGVFHGASSAPLRRRPPTRPRDPVRCPLSEGLCYPAPSSGGAVRPCRRDVNQHRQGVNHQPRPASQSDDPDPTGPGGR